MSTVHESPVPFFAGTVTMPDYLNYPQVLAYRDAVSAARAIEENQPLISYNYALLPGIIPCVEEWNIPKLKQPVTPDNFPIAPNRSSQKLLGWLINLVLDLMKEADDIPNA